ncbi:MAG: SIMPL domain-containing protein [Alphaproteobacteria bacterium]|nr:SIMPL domain-containing protein [Alphaproteobacteria bacterium]
MNRPFALILLTLANLFHLTPAKSQDFNTLLDIPEGATLVSLSATERVEVDQDLLVANLSIETKNTDAKALQNEINTIMTKALNAANTVKTVKASTQSYHVYPHDYNPDPRPLKTGEKPEIIREWRGSQGLMLKSKAPDDLLKLTGVLQEMGMNVTNLSYMVSPELLEETQNNLLEAAITKLKAKAQRTASALDKTKVSLLNINVDIGGYAPQPMMMARGMAMDAKMEMAAPVAAAGQSEITLSVNAQAMIK